MSLLSYKTLFKAAHSTHISTQQQESVSCQSVTGIVSTAEIEASEIVEENNAAMRAVEDVVDL